jgi:hypothetical protein
MKTVTRITLPLLGALFSSAAFAQDYTPILNQVQTIGRISLKETLSGDLMYVPALLSQQFFCNETNGVCTFQVYNQLNPDEEDQIRELRATGRNTLSYQSDLYREWLTIQSEELSGEITRLQSSFMTMKNLALLENPYGVAVFKSPNGNTHALADRYLDGGLGLLTVNYALKGVAQDFSIRISATELETLVLQRIDTAPMSFAELRDVVSDQISSFSIKGYLNEDAVVIIAYQIQEAFMKSVAGGELRLEPRKWAKFKLQKKPYWIASQSLRNGTEKCVATLKIQRNSKLEQKCEVEYENE